MNLKSPGRPPFPRPFRFEGWAARLAAHFAALPVIGAGGRWAARMGLRVGLVAVAVYAAAMAAGLAYMLIYGAWHWHADRVGTPRVMESQGHPIYDDELMRGVLQSAERTRRKKAPLP